MEQSLIKLLLSNAFYEANKHKIVRTMFPDELAGIYDVITEAHARYSRDLTLEEVRQLHRAANPGLTRAARNNIEELFTDIRESADVGEDVASDVLEHMWRTETGRRIADMGLDIMEGRQTTLSGLETLLEQTRDGFVPSDDVDPVTTDVEELVARMADRPRWKFNLPSLAQHVPGIGAGEFAIVFARPEMGKTASWVSLVAGPDGFAAQGANVHAICNEEPGERTLMRAISAYTGLTADEVIADPRKANRLFTPIKAHIWLVDDVDMTMEKLDGYCRRHKPDILILDQLDKIGINGSFGADYERLRATYIAARQIAKRHSCAVIALSQASADAEGKAYVHYSMLDGSKTGKAAEADLIIGIGRLAVDPSTDDMSRVLYASKNKISGWHGAVACILNKDLSRYEA